MNETSDRVLHEAVYALEDAARVCIQPELQRLTHFHSMRVHEHAAPDGCRVIRIALLLRSRANIDSVLRSIGTGCFLCEILSDVHMDFFCPLPLSDIFELRKCVLDRKMSCSFEITVSYARDIIVKLLEEWVTLLEHSAYQPQVDSEEHNEEREFHQHRTTDADILPGLQHPLKPPKYLQEFPYHR
ncbi:unnamed protein product [Chrysoparadoxa australica]